MTEKATRARKFRNLVPGTGRREPWERGWKIQEISREDIDDINFNKPITKLYLTLFDDV